jgi:hypothetical protein
MEWERTNLIQLDGEEIGSSLGQQFLGGFTVWAIRLAEYRCVSQLASLTF